MQSKGFDKCLVHYQLQFQLAVGNFCAMAKLHLSVCLTAPFFCLGLVL